MEISAFTASINTLVERYAKIAFGNVENFTDQRTNVGTENEEVAPPAP